jgi:hypothetical protein
MSTAPFAKMSALLVRLRNVPTAVGVLANIAEAHARTMVECHAGIDQAAAVLEKFAGLARKRC